MRSIIVHYHCYKNAGSSVDRSIINQFGREALLEVDKHADYRDAQSYNREFFETVIPKHPDVICFSSHRTVPTVHLIDGYNIIPVLFLRHPLLRVASAYRFEVKREDGEQYQEARRLSFHDWLRIRIEDPNRWEALNYQACIFSLREDGRPDLVAGSPIREVHFDRLQARLATLPFIGVVEEFDKSAEQFNALVRPHFQDFALGGAVNRTKVSTDWHAEVRELESELGAETMSIFKRGNQQDYALFEDYLAKITT